MFELPVLGERRLKLRDHKKAQRKSQHGCKLNMWIFHKFVQTAGPPPYQDRLTLTVPALPFVCLHWDPLVSRVVKQICSLHFSRGCVVVWTACLCQLTQSPAQHSGSVYLFWR